MEIYTYLLYSGAILALLSLFYWLILSKETFFQLNRSVLIGNLIIALSIPLIPAPKSALQLKQDLIASFSVTKDDSTAFNQTISGEVNTDTTQFAIEKEGFTDKVIQTTEIDTPTPSISTITLLKWLYFVGFSIMLFRFLIQIYAVYQQINRSEITKGAGYYLAVNNKDISPFSFWKYIVIKPNKYAETSFLHILEHERIHVIQRHTIDLVFAEIFLVFQWFNPLAWWHRQLIDQNLEFLVDQTLLDNGENKKTYQYHLVQVAVPNSPLSISSNYNSSQLKKRIKMMNLQRSSLAASWKYALLLPIAFLLLVGFTATPIEIETPIVSTDKIFKKAPTSSYVIITEDASEADLKVLQDQLFEFGFVLSFDKLVFDEKKIIELDAVLDYNDDRGISIPTGWNKNSPSPKVALFVNEANSRFGSYQLNEIMVNDLAVRIPVEEIFIAGNFSLPTVLNKFKAQIKAFKQKQKKQLQKNAQDPNWKGKLTKMSTSYGPVITKEEITSIKSHIVKRGYPTTYYLDGIKNDASVLDIRITEIENIELHEMRYRKFDKNGKFLNATPWTHEVKVKRKGKQKNAPKELNINQLEEVYIILTEEASKEDIKTIQSELIDYGLKLSITNLVYNDDNRIENIDAQLSIEGGTLVSQSWNKDVKGYKFMVLYKDWKNEETGVGNDIALLMKAQKVSQNGKLFIIGNKNVDELNQFLTEQAEKTKNIKKAKELINKSKVKTEQKTNQQKPPKRGFHYFEACDCYIPKTFSPSTQGSVFKIEGNDLNKKSSLNIYDKWGEEIYNAEPYKNDWNGLNNYGKKIDSGTYYFTFQADEGLEVVNEFIKIIEKEQEKNSRNATDFIDNPNEGHYVISPTTVKDFEQTKLFFKVSMFMWGMKQRHSSINLGDDASQPILIIRHFDNLEAAEKFRKIINNISDKPKNLKLFPISKSNYQIILEQKSLAKYEEFYKKL